MPMADADETAAITMEEAAGAHHHRPREVHGRGRAAAAVTLALGMLLGLALSAALLGGVKSGWSSGAGGTTNTVGASPWGRGVISLSEQVALKSNPAATAALVTRDFTAGAGNLDPQLSVKKGQAVFVSQRHKTDWTYAYATDGEEGWIPNTSLHAVVFMVMKDFTASDDGGPQPQLAVSQGDIVFVHTEHKDKWTYAYKISVGRKNRIVVHQGWLPDWALQSSMEQEEKEPSKKVLAEKHDHHKSVEGDA